MADPTCPNPFVVPGCEQTPNQPLCPWRTLLTGRPAEGEEDHLQYYRDVGGHEEAFSRFLQWANKAERLCARGAVIVVGGPQWSGKSSLLNRCVHWIYQSLHTAKTPVHVFDLTNACGRGLSTQERAKEVFDAGRIGLLRLRPPRWISDMLQEADKGDIGTLLRLMTEMSHIDDVSRSFVVILPRQEDDQTAWEEVLTYYDRVGNGVVCFFENAASQEPPPAFTQQKRPSLVLRMRPLAEEEPYQLIQKWPKASTISPEIPEPAVTRLYTLMREARLNLTTGVLLATLRQVFRARIDGTSTYQQLESVSQQEAVETMFKVILQTSQGMLHHD